MKILFVVPYVPSLIRARSYNLIRHLARAGATVRVATVCATAAERAELDALAETCADVYAVDLPAWRSMVNCFREIAGRLPLQAVYSWSRDLAQHVVQAARDCDVVHVEHLRGAKYAMAIRASGLAAPIVWDSVDCISYLFAQAAQRRTDRIGRCINRAELARTRRIEGQLAYGFDRVLVTSEIDRRALIDLAADNAAAHSGPSAVRSLGEDRIRVIANGVDTNYFCPGSGERAPATLVFSGKMSYHANVAAAIWLMREIMPAIWARRPAVRLTVVGKDPATEVMAAARPYSDRVVVTGTVPDVRPYLRDATLAVVPLIYGAGSQFKVLEAMACRTPVVASPQAVAALTVTPGLHLAVADGAYAFADEVLRLLDDADRRARMGDAGRDHVVSRHSWATVAEDLARVYLEVIERRARTSEEVALPTTPTGLTQSLPATGMEARALW